MTDSISINCLIFLCIPIIEFYWWPFFGKRSFNGTCNTILGEDAEDFNKTYSCSIDASINGSTLVHETEHVENIFKHDIILTNDTYYQALIMEIDSKQTSQLLDTIGYKLLSPNELLGNNDMLEYSESFLSNNYWSSLSLDPYWSFRYVNYSKLILSPSLNNIKLLKYEEFILPKQYTEVLGNIPRDFAPLSLKFLKDPFILSYLWKIYSLLPNNNSNIDDEYYISLFTVRVVKNSINNLNIVQNTPEGVHKDGCNYAVITLMGRDNVNNNSATTHIYNNKAIKGVNQTEDEIKFNENEALLHEYTLKNTFETFVLNDEITHHSIDPPMKIENKNKNNGIATRDIMLTLWMNKQFKMKNYQ